MDKSVTGQTMGQFDEFVNLVVLYGENILLGMLILVVGLIAAQAVNKLLRRALAKFINNNAVVSIMSSIVFVLLLVFVVAAGLQQAGLEGIVVRRIIFASTMAIVFLIILFRPYLPTLPFKAGHFIKTGDLLGKVEATTLINTRIKTVDGKTVFVPNSIILKDYLINYYSTPIRRVEVDVGIGYDQDLLKAKQIMEILMIEDPRILDDPRPVIYVVNLAESCVELSARGWVNNVKYWKTRCEILEKVKLRFDQENIKIAFPQLDVHLHHETLTPIPQGEEIQDSNNTPSLSTKILKEL
jgi:small conductance mechanosensitive channel